MRDYSTMSTFEYVISVIWKLVIGWSWYKNYLFRILKYQGIYGSLYTMAIMVVVSVVTITVVFWHRKNGWISTACVALPFGIYTIRAYISIFSQWMMGILIFVAVLALLWSGAMLLRRVEISDGKSRKRIYRRRISKCVYTTVRMITVAMLALMVGIGGRSYLGTALMNSNVEPEGLAEENKEENTIDSNMDTVLKLQPEVWSELNTQERLDVLQTVCNIEVNYLGLYDPITVQGDNLSYSTLGAYSDELKLIYINLDHIENDPVEEVLHTLLHEVHHSYEHRLIDIYDSVSPEYQDLRIMKDASHYAEEKDNYIDAETDYFAYANQSMELDSDTYAENGVKDYYERIDEWLAQNG